MNEESISKHWNDPDDAPKLTRSWFDEADLMDGDTVVRRGRPPSENPKKAVSLRLDPEVISFFKNAGPGWQTRVNDALRKVAGL